MRLVSGVLVLITASLLACGTRESPAADQSAGLPPVFSNLEGSWEGTGVLLGRPAAFAMSWEVGTAGFVYLTFSNAWVEEDGTSIPVLSARATYLVSDSSALGVWVDDRPQRLTLDAVVTDSSVVTNWIAEAEEGRTEYVVRASTGLVVRDFVTVDGAERPFAEASYRRSPTDPAR